jgi:hypothetical protein
LAAKCKGKGRLWKLFRGMVYLRMKEKLWSALSRILLGLQDRLVFN